LQTASTHDIYTFTAQEEVSVGMCYNLVKFQFCRNDGNSVGNTSLQATVEASIHRTRSINLSYAFLPSDQTPWQL